MDEDRRIEQRPAGVWPAKVEYPDSDGLPLAENEVQAYAIRASFGALQQHYKPAEQPYIASDLLLYYVEGDPNTSVAPDLMVVFGVEVRRRPSYKLWEEGKPPEFVLEVSSPSSRKRDRREKLDLYADLGVREYFVFDPGGVEDADEDGDGELAGYRLWGRAYVECGVSRQPSRQLESEALGLLLRPEGRLVRFRDPQTGRDLRIHQEDAEALREAEQELEEERRARLRLEEQVADLKNRISDS